MLRYGIPFKILIVLEDGMIKCCALCVTHAFFTNLFYIISRVYCVILTSIILSIFFIFPTTTFSRFDSVALNANQYGTREVFCRITFSCSLRHFISVSLMSSSGSLPSSGASMINSSSFLTTSRGSLQLLGFLHRPHHHNHPNRDV